MPTWTTHTEGGSWKGGGTEVPNCSSSEQAAIRDAYNSFINDPCLDCFPGLERDLRETWESVEIDCDPGVCDDSSLNGQWDGSKLTLCCSNISSGCSKSSNRLEPLVLHELVHAVGGTELDAEAAEWKCFNGSGATAPTSGDFDKFRDDEGNYAIWDNNTGEVWGNDGGSKGTKCFQSSQWQKSFSGGGGGGGW